MDEWSKQEKDKQWKKRLVKESKESSEENAKRESEGH